MPTKLTQNSATDSFSAHLKYSIYSLIEEDQTLRDLAPIPQAALTALLAQDQAKTELDDTELQNRSSLSAQERRNTVIVYALIALLEKLTRSNPAFARLQEQITGGMTLTQITSPRGTGVGLEVRTIRLIAERITLLGDAAPEELRAMIAPLQAAAAATEQRLNTLTSTLFAIDIARANLQQAKTDALNALARLRAELTALFPRNRAYVNQFFLSVNTSRKPAGGGEQEPGNTNN